MAKQMKKPKMLNLVAKFKLPKGINFISGIKKPVAKAVKAVRELARTKNLTKIEKIERKELKQDRIQERLLSVVQWVNGHRALMWSVLAVLLCLGLMSTGGLWWLQQQRLKAATAYQEIKTEDEGFFDIETGQASQSEDSEDKVLDPRRQALTDFIKGYGKSVQAVAAWMSLAELAWDDGNLVESQRAFKQASQHGKALPLQKAVAWMGLAKIAERQNLGKEAAEYYAKLQEQQHVLLAAWHEGNLNLYKGSNELARQNLEILLRQSSRTDLEELASDLLRFIP